MLVTHFTQSWELGNKIGLGLGEGMMMMMVGVDKS